MFPSQARHNSYILWNEPARQRRRGMQEKDEIANSTKNWQTALPPFARASLRIHPKLLLFVQNIFVNPAIGLIGYQRLFQKTHVKNTLKNPIEQILAFHSDIREFIFNGKQRKGIQMEVFRKPLSRQGTIFSKSMERFLLVLKAS